MKAIQLTGPKNIELVDMPKPTPSEGEVLVRAERLSICGSDMRAFRRVLPEEDYPLKPGGMCHEIVGIIEESREPSISPGLRVIALPSSESGSNLSGGGSEYMVTSANRIIPLPDNADPSTFIMCQPVGTVLFACQRMGSVFGKSVVVLGQGAIGLSFTSLLSGQGAREIVGVDLHDYRLAKSNEQGATLTLNPLKEDVFGAVSDLTGGYGADIVVEATGTAEGFNMIPDVIRQYGTAILFGLPEEEIIPFQHMKWLLKAPTIIPTHSASSPDPTRAIKEAVYLADQGRLDVNWLVTHNLSFDQAPEAYEMYEGYTDNIIKVIMTP